MNQLEGLFDTALADNSLDLSEAAAGSEDDVQHVLSAERDQCCQYLLGENAQELQTIVVHPKCCSSVAAARSC